MRSRPLLPDRATTRSALAALALLTAAPGATGAQWRIEVGVGAVGSTPVVRDSIVRAFHVAPAPAPTLHAGLGIALDGRQELLVTAAWSRADLRRRVGDTTFFVVGVTQWRLTLDLRRQIRPWLAARGALGALRYAPGEEGRDASVLREGAATFALVGAGAEAGVPLRPGLGAVVALRYDLHRFTTLALGDEGFGGARTVHRLSAGVVLRASRGR